MRIDSIDYINYRGLGTGHIDFEPGMTVVIGNNGSGKTSVLKAVAIAVSWIVARLKSEKSNGLYINEDSITNGYNHSLLTASFDEISGIDIPNKSKIGVSKRYALNIDPLKDYVAAKREQFDATGFHVSSPVFAFYGVKRAVVDIPLRTRDSDFSLMNAYDDCLNGRANFRNFFIWFRNQEDVENEERARTGDVNYSSRELDAFRRALNGFIPEYRNIHVRRRPLRMVIEKNGELLNVSQLSDGEKIFLALIGDLTQRLVLANPTLPDPLTGEGIVLIDEIDLHLHPEWQVVIADRLTSVFPNIQFVVSTHSPHVINRVDSACLRILNGSEVMKADYGYGMPSLVVLKDIMGLKNDEPRQVEELKDNLIVALSDGKLVEAETMLSELQRIVPGHPELVKFRKLFERLGRKK